MRIYLAGPYTFPDPEENTKRAIQIADKLISKGNEVYVPHLFHYWHLISPKTYEEWLEIGLSWLKICEAIARIPGYSKGSDIEMEIAKSMGHKRFLVDDAGNLTLIDD